MKKLLASTFAWILLAAPIGAFAETSCEGQAKPAFDCPTGYSMMCIPTGGDHWGCGRETPDGQIAEAPTPQEAPPAGTAETKTEPAAAPVPVTAPAESPTAAPAAARPTTANPVINEEPPAATAYPDPAPPEGALIGAPPIGMPPQEAFESFQDVLEYMVERSPSPLAPLFTTAAATLAVVATVLGSLEWLRRMRERKSGKCARCGNENDPAGPCRTCEGKKTVEDEHEGSVECRHCHGEGEDPCHVCEGKDERGVQACAACRGTGKTPGEKEGEETIDCCTCGGEGEVTGTFKREVPCPDCAR